MTGNGASRPRCLIFAAMKLAAMKSAAMKSVSLWAVAVSVGLLACVPVIADNPASLFWHMDTMSLAEGGADIPGQIAGRPQVARPTSLAHTDGGLVRINHSANTPLSLVQSSWEVGRWDTSISSQELVFPVGGAKDARRWTIGIENLRVSDDIRYHSARYGYNASLESNRRMVGASYQSESGWIAGAVYGWGESAATAWGKSVADNLRLPADTTDWPNLRSDVSDCTLGLSRRQGRWEYGLQHSWATPSALMSVTRKTYHYTAPIESDTKRSEAYVAYRKGAETWFTGGWDYESHGAGTILVGAIGRGDVDGSMDDSSLAVGWRKTKGRAVQQVVLDSRKTRFGTYDQVSEGPLPGLGSDVRCLRANGKISTVSLRYGRQTPLADDWLLLSGLGFSYADVDFHGRVRNASGIGRDPETIVEYDVAGGLLRLLSLSLGVAYQTDRLRAAFTCTGGYAAVSDAFHPTKPDDGGGGGGGGGDPPPPTPGHKNSLRPKYLLTFTTDYYF